MNDENPYRSPREYGEGRAGWNVRHWVHLVAAAVGGLSVPLLFALVAVDLLLLGAVGRLATWVYGTAFTGLAACLVGGLTED